MIEALVLKAGELDKGILRLLLLLFDLAGDSSSQVLPLRYGPNSSEFLRFWIFGMQIWLKILNGAADISLMLVEFSVVCFELAC